MDEMTMSLAGAAVVQPSHPDARGPAPKPSATAGHDAKVEAAEVYYSPKGRIDPSSGLYVLQVRDSESGEVIQQYPQDKGAQDYQRTADAAGPPVQPVTTAAAAPVEEPTAAPAPAPAPAPAQTGAPATETE